MNKLATIGFGKKQTAYINLSPNITQNRAPIITINL